MSNVTVQTRETKASIARRPTVEAGRAGLEGHAVTGAGRSVARWKGLYLILAFSVLLGIETFVLATNFELSLFSPPEMVFETLKSALQVSLLIGLIIGADSISGERERGTLEGILLTPASRRQIIFGKFVAALSAWPVTLAITIPFMFGSARASVRSRGPVVGGAMVGLVLIPAFVAIGMLVTFFCS